MFQGYKRIIVISAILSLVNCYCPREKIRALGNCSFKITCFGTIRDIAIERRCFEAINYSNTIQVNLKDAIERFDENIDTQLLSIITTLEISANWQEANLAILKYTYRLQNLKLNGIGLEKISPHPFSYLNYLENLDLSHNKLKEIGDLFTFDIEPNNFKNLSLAHNEIEVIPSYAFDELSSLTELDLSYNRISGLTEEPFQNLTNLEVLRLNNNRITDLNGAVNNLHKLQHLFVRGNRIQNINDESLKIIEHLDTFDISLNELELIKPILFLRHWDHIGNHSLCKIILSENRITHIPNGTDKAILSRYIKNLDKHTVDTEVNLSRNSIEYIDYNAFQSVIRIVALDLSHNRLTDFIINSYDLGHLEYLNMSHNYISQLYFESFSRMNNLQNLDLSNNKLDFIPDMTFNNNNKLKLVNMTYNGIDQLESIHIPMFHQVGGVLDLSHNGLFKLIVPYGEGIRMITLLIHSNNISDPSLINLKHQTELRDLDMSKNSILDLNVSSLLLPETLVSLDLSCNRIQNLGPSTFYSLKHLKTLRLSHNDLQQFEYGTFQGMTELQNLDLSYNLIKNLDSTYLTDLKSLRVLSVRSNDMFYFDYKNWYGHKYEVLTYIDNNHLTCEWLGKALYDFNNEYSRMRPTVLVRTKALHTVEDIPCVTNELQASTDINSKYVLADERLLMTSQKILQSLRQQNAYMWKFMRHVLIEESRRENLTHASA